MIVDAGAVAIVYAGLAFGGLVKGMAGIGLPSATLAVTALFVSPVLAVASLVAPLVITNLAQVVRSGGIAQSFRRHGGVALSLAGSLALATLLVTRVSTSVLIAVIGLAVTVFAASSLIREPPALPPALRRPLGLVAGVLGGLLGGLSTVWAPPIVMYFQACRLGKDEFVQATGLVFLAGSVPLSIGYLLAGVLDGPLLLVTLGGCLPALLGFWLGERLRAHVSVERFRTVILVVFLFSGLNLLRRGLMGEG